MEDHSKPSGLILPDQKNYDVSYGLALKLAAEKLHDLEHMQEQCLKSDSLCGQSASGYDILVKYLNRLCRVSWPGIEITFADSPETVDIKDKILILDYLNTAGGTPLSGTPIAFQELSDVSNYYPSFFKRAVKPLMDYFGSDPQRLLDAARPMGGAKASYGDVSVTIPAFSRVPITLVVWQSDEEFPANANILFDTTVRDYLSAEGLIVLCQNITWRLVKSLSSHSQNLKP